MGGGRRRVKGRPGPNREGHCKDKTIGYIPKKKEDSLGVQRWTGLVLQVVVEGIYVH